jgi:hypothetical protein
MLRGALLGYGLAVTDRYAPPDKRPPLLADSVPMGIFSALFAAALLPAKRRGRQLPERPAAADVALSGVAAHKFSRLIGKDKTRGVNLSRTGISLTMKNIVSRSIRDRRGLEAGS